MRGVFVPSAVQKTTLIADHSKGFSSKKIFGIFRSLGVFCEQYQLVALQRFSSGSDSQPDDHQVHEAWITSIDFKNLYGFPMGSKMCDGFLPLSSKRSVHAKAVKPDAMAFNQVLDACVRFKSSLKGQEIVHLMSQTELILDMHKQELLIFWSGKLLLSNRALAKLVNGYRRHGRTSELSKLLPCIQQDFHALSQSSLCSDVD
ncbi:hypothetical protein POTOM_001229 [Populus tomentosa]|uniref:Uncharacterized protein n=1 Tax=Populus tomentosa TaxID=118781 RepID=A0A8X8DHJ1_POPTO|nr:hypothetical protein POTOM_001229 [Populus tomentosa]